ncbi:ATP-binding protein [Alteribacter lacisalsi]|nr:ATP-binding protein [Alteribacter lacisalsi]
MTLFRDLIHNLFYIITPVFLYYTFWSRYTHERRRSLYFLIFFALCAASMLLSMMFPVEISGFQFDFRYLAVIFALLYGSWVLALVLFLVQAGYRLILIGASDPGFYLFFSALSFAGFYLLSRHYQSFNLRKKAACYLALLAVICSLSAVFSFSRFTDNRLDMLTYMSQFFLLYAIVSLLLIYTIERMITNQRMKEDLRKSEQLRTVSELAASVAHEVRNPMTVARGFVQLMQSSSSLTNSEKKYLQLTISEIDRAQHIISDYLNLAKPKDPSFKTISVSHALDEVRHTIQAYALMNNVSVFLDVPSGLKIRGEEKEFMQVLLNLCKNGIEAMPDGGKLFLTAALAGSTVRIGITDTGTGMTNEQVRQLGRAYYTTKDKGTGLGLMVSFTIIRSWGGQIDVKSEPGNGTVFTIILPAESADEPLHPDYEKQTAETVKQ